MVAERVVQGIGCHDGGMQPTSRSRSGLVGALLVVLGAAAAEGVAAALGLEPGPTRLVAGWVRDATPGDLAVRLVHLVGDWDKPLLVIGTGLGLAAVGGVAGWYSVTKPWIWDFACAALILIGLAAVLAHESRVRGVAAIVVAAVVWWAGPRFVHRPTAEPLGRRGFLLRVGAVGVGIGGLALGGWSWGQGRRRVEAARALIRLPVEPGDLPESADLGLRGVARWRTPNETFFRIDTALSVPTVSPEEWRLRIYGMVDRELEFSYEDLVSRGLQGAWITLCCVSNPTGGDLVGNAWWGGVPIRELLAEAGLQSGADAVKQTSADGWTCGTPLAALTDKRNAMVALAMNGAPLPVEHGFPARIVVPGLYGYVSATKWVTDLEVTRFADFDAYWTTRGWAEQAPVKTASRIDVPRQGATVGVGVARFGGVAWAQHRGISRVEVQLDGGPWQEAVLGGVAGVDTWVQWSLTANLDAGDHVLVVRATDKLGRTQTGVRRDVVPDGATGWHTVEFTAS